MVQFYDYETISLDRPSAAFVAGVSADQAANWIRLHGLFPEKRKGKGEHFQFTLQDCFALACIRVLTDAGMQTAAAVAAIRSYSPYSSLFDRAITHPAVARAAGTFVVTQNEEGRWVGVDGPNKPMAVHLHLWPILEKMLPRYSKAVAEYAMAIEPAELASLRDEYLNTLAERRKAIGA